MSAVYEGPPASISTRLASSPSTSATAAATMPKRSSAGDTVRVPAFCQGTLFTTSSTRSSPSS